MCYNLLEENFMKVISKSDEKGKVVYSSDILYNLVLCAIKEVDGVVDFDINDLKSAKRQKMVKIETINHLIYVDVYVKVRPDIKVPEVAFNIQHAIKNAFDTMVDFKVKEINVHIIEVKTDTKPD